MVRSKPAGQRLKVQHARQAVSVTMDLLGIDLLEASLWLDVRKAQDPQRAFGSPATAVWTALRRLVPLTPDPASIRSAKTIAAGFVKSTPASAFYVGAELPGDGK